MRRKPIRGTKLFSLSSQALVSIQKHGLLLSLAHYLPRFVSRFGAGKFLWAVHLAWKARLVWYWRWSPRVSDDEYIARDAICLACERQKVTGKGRFCQQCGCADWRWSELTVKNAREGHFCPLGKHPGQTPMPTPVSRRVAAPKSKSGCKGCGSKKTNGKSMDAARLEVPAALERTELPAVDRS